MEDRLLRGELISTLIHQHPIDGVKLNLALSGAVIIGEIDLVGIRQLGEFHAADCFFSGPILLDGAEVSGNLKFERCFINGVSAAYILVRRNIVLVGTHVGDNLWLNHANVLGDITVSESVVAIGAGMSADCANIAGSFEFNKGSKSFGKISLIRAQIGLHLDFDNVQIGASDQYSLVMDGVVVKGCLFIVGTRITRGVRMVAATIFGTATLRGSRFNGPKGCFAAHGCSIRSAISIKNSVFRGLVEFTGARLSSDLLIDNCRIATKKGFALSLERTTIRGFCHWRRLSCRGGITFHTSTLKDDLRVTELKVTAPGVAIGFDSLNVLGAVLFRKCRISGLFRCRSAIFQRDVTLLDVELKAGSPFGFDGSGLTCEGDFRFASNSSVTSAFVLDRGRFHSDLILENCLLQNRQGVCLSLSGSKIDGEFKLDSIPTPIESADLSSTTVGRLNDDIEVWGPKLDLVGFTYGIIERGCTLDADKRIHWLLKQHSFSDRDFTSDFSPLPWRHLAHVLRSMGYLEDARQILIAFEKQLYKSGRIGKAPLRWPSAGRYLYSRVSMCLHRCYGFLIGYGYQPLRLVTVTFAAWICFGTLYWTAANAGVFAPTDPLIYQSSQYASCRTDLERLDKQPRMKWFSCLALPAEYTAFSPFAYSFEVLVPFVDLGQRRSWAPMVRQHENTWINEIGNWTFAHFVRLAVWVQTCIGWIASLLIVATVSGLSRKWESAH